MHFTIHEAAAAMRRGELMPVDLLDQCLGRIDAYEPAVKAWVVVDRDGAREQAERLTAELKRGEDRGPLHGIPVGVKDIIDVFDLPIGCGSKLWANSVARQDAACVKRLRQVGAVILGKTVTTAYAYLDPPATRNPWNLERTPGGSSSGSAAAVACGMCLAALGTQTVGSLTRPASYCGVCSFKPRHATVDVDGVLPLAPTLDHVGVMARCVTDLAILADTLIANEWRSCASYVRDESQRPLWPICAVGGLFEERSEPGVWANLMEAWGTVREKARPNVLKAPSALAELPVRLRAILTTEAAHYHGPRFRRRPDDYPPKIAGLIDEGLRALATDYYAAQDHREEMRRQVNELVEGGALRHTLLTPAATGPAPDRATTGDAAFNAPWSYTGHPTVSLPIGRLDGLPLAAQLVGAYYATADVFAAAARLEHELNYHVGLPPEPSR